MKRHYLDEINKVEINLSTNETETSPFEADQSTILRAASILANKILDTAKQSSIIIACEKDVENLKHIEQEFAKDYVLRLLTTQEKEKWIKQLHDFYDFRIAEIARQKEKLIQCEKQK